MASSRGKVILVGAGPGAADLLTLRAAERLKDADVVLVDELVDGAVLAHCDPRARVIRVGKRGGCRSTPQRFIERLMRHYATQGCTVVRLKGGDPFVFGRGGEEREYLVRHGIEVEVVPGLTAGIGLPGLAGIPVTHRGLASGVTFVSGHTAVSREPEWARLAQLGTTLVIYMGLLSLPRIVERLLAAGMRLDTPAAVIARGSLPDAQVVAAPLAAIARACAEAAIAAPALVVIGEVVALGCSSERIEPSCTATAAMPLSKESLS
jgi:uroporphyrin-III C-methyltransferase